MPEGLEKIAPEVRERFLNLLRELAADRTKRVFAVLDGAQIRDLPQRLGEGGSQPECGLAHVPLYQGEDRGKILAGPWLVSPYVYGLSLEDRCTFSPNGSFQLKEKISYREADPPTQMDALFGILDDPRAAAFWIGDHTLTATLLFHHLRGLNMVSARLPGEPDGAPPQMIHFRHADANAMAQIIPALDQQQTARLLGPANMLVVLPHPLWSETAVVAQRLENSPNPNPKAGPLFLDARTMKDIEDQRKQGFERKIAASLKKTAPGLKKSMSLEELRLLVSSSMKDAAQYGVKSEAAHYRWAWLTLASDGQFSRAPEVRAFMNPGMPGPAPDERVKLLMKRILSLGHAALLSKA